MLLQACFPRRQKARCCWQIDLQTNSEVLFFKRSLSVFIGAAAALHGNGAAPRIKPAWEVFFFFKGCRDAACLTTKRHPGSPAKEDQYLNYAVVGQHVRVYKIKWGLKLISSSPWKSLQVFINETRRRSAAERRWPPPRHIHNCFCFSKLNEPFYRHRRRYYYYYYFHIAELGGWIFWLWHVRF